VPDQAKPPVFLLDTMSFIFRAYHAMQRSRPMSTRGGLPTAAIYVFVNMIKKLRQDFAPLYFAAVFDVSGEVFRDERARTMGPLRKWNSRRRAFDDVTYEGYKANREAMPEDLRRRFPTFAARSKRSAFPSSKPRALRPTTSSAPSPAKPPSSSTKSSSSPATRT
jgi:5'-3' exonuclease